VILCLDSGNSRLKVGLGGRGDWRERASLARGDGSGLRALLAQWPRPQRAFGCNVAGADAARGIEGALSESGVALTWVAAAREAAGVRSLYDDPSQLGADRWAALLGARAAHAGACLVVNCGTATTIDVLDAAGVFQGGLILPGLSLMRSSLGSATAQLRPAPGQVTALPRNTDDAIASGCIAATAGAVLRMFAHIAGQATPLCLLCGGAAEALEPHLGLPLRRIDTLVLDGLARFAEG